MNYKIILKGLLAVSFFGFFAGFMVMSPENFGFCKSVNDFDCIFSFQQQYGFLQYVSILSVVLFIIAGYFLASAKIKTILRCWARFSAIFLVISVFIISKASDGGFSPVQGKAVTAYFLFWLFLLVSLILIVYKSLKLKKNKP